MTTIGALNAVLSMDSAAFIADTGKARAALGTFAATANTRLASIDRSMTSFMSTARMAAGVFGVSFGAAALMNFTRGMIQAADRLTDTAAQIGITTQQLQEFQYAARITGGSAEGMAGALGTLSDRLGDAAKGEGELAKIMRELHIPMGTTVEVLYDLADATKNAETQTERARITTAAFARAGKENISFLEQGAAGIKHQADEAHRWNQVWDNETTKKLGDLNEAFSTLGATLTTLAAPTIASGLTNLSKGMNEIANIDWSNFLKGSAALYGRMFQFNGKVFSDQPFADSAVTAPSVVSGIASKAGRAAVPNAPTSGGDPAKDLLKQLGLPDVSVSQFQETLSALRRQQWGPGGSMSSANVGGASIGDLTGAGGITDMSDQVDNFTNAVKRGAYEAQNAWGGAMGMIEGSVTNAFLTMEDTFVRFVTTGKLSFHDLANSIIVDLARIAARRLITDTLSNVLFNALSGGMGGSGGGLDKTLIDTGYRAGGGPVSAGGLYMVGENGPELFSPSRSGSVIPNGGGEIHVVVHLSDDLNGRIAGISDSRIAGAAPGLISASVVATKNSIRNRGGRIG